MSSAEPIYASRVLKLPLVTPDGDAVGRVDDLVIGPPTGETAPILLGLVAQVGRRRIFVSAPRVKHFETSGVVRCRLTLTPSANPSSAASLVGKNFCTRLPALSV